MRRAPPALALLLAWLALGATRTAAAACESARPTDAAGAAGISYGSAKVAFLDSGSGRARVHYALSGSHAPPATSTVMDGVPDAVVFAAQAADDALDTYADLSFRAPLSDGDSPCDSNGDSAALDIYLIHFASADGQTAFDHCDAGTPRKCATFVLVDSSFSSGYYADVQEGMRTVVPHELFHAVQDAYDADVERFWAEGSAQWAAKHVYPDLRDLGRFLPEYFATPWRPLNVPPSGVVAAFLYATAIWPVFLEQRYDASLVRQVFEDFGEGPSDVMASTDHVLTRQGSSLAQEFLQFATYNAATGARAPEHGGYADAASYPLVPVKPLDAVTGKLTSDVDSGLGAFYYSLTATAPSELSLEADPSRVAAMWLPLRDGLADLSGAAPLPASVEGEGIVVVAGQSTQRSDAPFSLQLATAPGDADPGGPAESSCSAAAGAAKSPWFSGIMLGLLPSVLRMSRRRLRRPRRSRACAKVRTKRV